MQLRSFVYASLVLAAFFLAPAKADAQIISTVTFDAVTSYRAGAGDNPFYSMALVVTGVQHGAGGPSTVNFQDPHGSKDAASSYFAACEKQLLVAINRPGRVSITLAYHGTTPPSTGVAAPVTLEALGCTLTQLP
jgi:hypothetical protein